MFCPKCCHFLLLQVFTSSCIFLTLHHLVWNLNHHCWENMVEKKLYDMLKVYSNMLGLCQSDATDSKQNCTALFEESLFYFTVFRLQSSSFSFPHHVMSCCSLSFLTDQHQLSKQLQLAIELLKVIFCCWVVWDFCIKKKKQNKTEHWEG